MHVGEHPFVEEPNSLASSFESLILGSTCVIMSGAIEDSSRDLDSCVENCPTYSMRNISQNHLSGLELSCFISRIHSRPSDSSHDSSSKSLCHIVVALRHLLLSVDVEVLVELSCFFVEANSLIDCTVLVLKARGLQL